MSTPISLRTPSTLSSSESSSATIPPPTLQWLSGAWHVTHSTLPMWNKNQNVVITYTPVPDTFPTQIDDVVTYQSVGSTKTKSVHGLDKPFDVHNTTPEGKKEDAEGLASMAYAWRGKGWLMIASSKWEILGWGEEAGTGNSWVVTYFAKTLFTPAGVDFYSRKGMLSEEVVQGIQEAMRKMGGDVEKLAGEVFEVVMTGESKIV